MGEKCVAFATNSQNPTHPPTLESRLRQPRANNNLLQTISEEEEKNPSTDPRFLQLLLHLSPLYRHHQNRNDSRHHRHILPAVQQGEEPSRSHGRSRDHEYPYPRRNSKRQYQGQHHVPRTAYHARQSA